MIDPSAPVRPESRKRRAQAVAVTKNTQTHAPTYTHKSQDACAHGSRQTRELTDTTGPQRPPGPSRGHARHDARTPSSALRHQASCGGPSASSPQFPAWRRHPISLALSPRTAPPGSRQGQPWRHAARQSASLAPHTAACECTGHSVSLTLTPLTLRWPASPHLSRTAHLAPPRRGNGCRQVRKIAAKAALHPLRTRRVPSSPSH